MTGKYAGSEVIQMAVEIEKKGKAFYDGVIEATKDIKVREIFQFLSDEEVRHEKLFRNMLSGLETRTEGSPYDDTEMILYFRSLIDRKIFPDEDEGQSMKDLMGSSQAAIQVALSFEQDAILFFHELHGITHEKDQKTVENIIKEERDHIQRILKLKKEMQV